MSYEDVKCPVCHRVGQNIIETYKDDITPTGWLICKCGHAIMELEE